MQDSPTRGELHVVSTLGLRCQVGALTSDYRQISTSDYGIGLKVGDGKFLLEHLLAQ